MTGEIDYLTFNILNVHQFLLKINEFWLVVIVN